MKKVNLLFLFPLAVLLMFGLGSCGKDPEVAPLPDFRALLIEAGTFKGDKYEKPGDPFTFYPNIVVTVKAGNNPNEVILTEGDRSFTVKLDSAKSNAVRLVIPAQKVNNIHTYVGVPLNETGTDKSHGYYTTRDASKTAINELLFRVSIDNRKLTYYLKKQ